MTHEISSTTHKEAALTADQNVAYAKDCLLNGAPEKAVFFLSGAVTEFSKIPGDLAKVAEVKADMFFVYYNLYLSESGNSHVKKAYEILARRAGLSSLRISNRSQRDQHNQVLEETSLETFQTLFADYQQRFETVPSNVGHPEIIAGSAYDHHVKAEHLREYDNQFANGLQYAEMATVEYLREGKVGEAGETQSSAFLALKQLHKTQSLQTYDELAENCVNAAVEIAEVLGENTEAITLPLLNRAKYKQEKRDFLGAITDYQRALISPLPERHNRQGVRADIEIRLRLCEYANLPYQQLAEKQVKVTQIEAAILTLRNSEEDQYNKDIWLSGAYLQLFLLLEKTSPEKAEIYLLRSEEIANNNVELDKRRVDLKKIRERKNNDYVVQQITDSYNKV